MSLSWKPRSYTKDGIERYCASACGSDCTREKYFRADRLATHMVVRLGPQWRKRVTENMGWHASAHHKTGVDVHASVDREGRVTYSAFYRSWCVSGPRNPVSALRALIREVKRDVTAHTAMLTAMESL